MGNGQVRRALVGTIVAAVVLVAPLAGVAAAGGSGGSGDNEVVATLKVDADNVSVQKAGAEKFKPAKDGQKMREGDTVQTDATGRAEVDYSDDAYTRLDVNTTFTIVKLTEEQGERQIEGSIESGRTWNRTAAVTESGSFDQSGGGATAAVTGTAFPVDCTSQDQCVFTGVEGTFILTGNGEERTVAPLDQCDSTSGDLCDSVDHLTIEEIAAISWIQENLFRDLVERGLGDGPFVVPLQGTLTVENGVVVSFNETQSPTGSTTTTSTTTTSTTTTTSPPPYIDPESPVAVESPSVEATASATCTPNHPGYTPSPGISAEDEEPATFVVNACDPSGLPFTVRFPTLPTNGVLCAPAAEEFPTTFDCVADGPVFYSPVPYYQRITDEAGNDYNTTMTFVSDTQFKFAPVDHEDEEPLQSSATVEVDNGVSPPVTATVPIQVYEDDDE